MSKKKINLNPDQILLNEFQYIAESAKQANEDRINIASYFTTATISNLATILFDDAASEFPAALFVLALFLWSFGIIISLKIIKLRHAWSDSVKAMNAIKSFYIKQYSDLDEAIVWKVDTIPSLKKRWSISFLTYLSILLVGSISLGFGTFYLLFYSFEADSWLAFVASISIVVIEFTLRLVLWNLLMKKPTVQT
jgi:hypothetical protein